MASRDIKVGLFVVFSLAVIGLVVFLIGEERQLFAKHQEVRAAFKDVNGLGRGSPVRMGGVDIGTVKSLGYGGDSKDDTIYVDLDIVSTEAERIRTDSVAEVKAKGLLGDKMIVITVGSVDKPQLKHGEMVKTKESRDLETLMHDLKKTAAGAEKVVINLEKTTAAFADEAFHGDIKQAVQNLNEITGSLARGEGYAGRLLNDKQEAERLSAAVGDLRKSAAELNQLLTSARKVVDRVRTGPGFAHEVLYEEKGSQAISQIGGAAEEFKLALAGIREDGSLAHELLYDDQSGQMVENLNLASADLQQIVADVRAGKGTVGAFLVDPSVYEDIKVLLGNVGRNRSLRALVRYSIKQDEQSGRVVDPGTTPSASASSEGGKSTTAPASLETAPATP